ncbi:MAG: SsrA-binding protein SmpB [Bradymonadales bacterium]|jgi:SsrA-binding protein
MAKQTQRAIKIIAKNRRAYFDYFIEEKIEAGIVLLGSEVKSIRAGHVSLGEAYAKFSADKGEELYLMNCHIAEYPWANRFNHEPLRPRKLLLHKRQLQKLSQAVVREGRTLIPLILYFSQGRIKLELGLAKGKKNYDKREALKQNTAKREIERGQ